jgi:hypothetical protein
MLVDGSDVDEQLRAVVKFRYPLREADDQAHQTTVALIGDQYPRGVYCRT